MSQLTPNHTLQNQVDLILFEEGCFSPLSWLLKEGYLAYSDYQQWKQGTVDYLEDHLNLSAAEVITELKHAQDYALSLKLDSYSQAYTSITGQALQCCRSRAHESIFTTVFEPARNRQQLDLFFDSAAACTEFDLIQAIINQKQDDIHACLAKLKTTDPEKHQSFIRLLTFERNLTEFKQSSGEKITLLLKTVSPLAFEILGRFAYDFLTPLWHRLTEETAGRNFAADAPEWHASFTAFKGFQWLQVVSSIERERNWEEHPVLLYRHAEACFKLGREREGLINWFKLFIRFPETAEQMIENTSNRLLFSDWRLFHELDPELEADLFPAWMVMNKPALAKQSIHAAIHGNDTLQLIEDLVCNTGNDINDQAILLRARLQQDCHALFIHYMNMKENKLS